MKTNSDSIDIPQSAEHIRLYEMELLAQAGGYLNGDVALPESDESSLPEISLLYNNEEVSLSGKTTSSLHGGQPFFEKPLPSTHGWQSLLEKPSPSTHGGQSLLERPSPSTHGGQLLFEISSSSTHGGLSLFKNQSSFVHGEASFIKR